MNIIALYISMMVASIFQGNERELIAVHDAKEAVRPYIEAGQVYWCEDEVIAANDSMYLIKVIANDKAPSNKGFYVVMKVIDGKSSFDKEKAVYEYIFSEPGPYALKRLMKNNGWVLR